MGVLRVSVCLLSGTCRHYLLQLSNSSLHSFRVVLWWIEGTDDFTFDSGIIWISRGTPPLTPKHSEALVVVTLLKCPHCSFQQLHRVYLCLFVDHRIQKMNFNTARLFSLFSQELKSTRFLLFQVWRFQQHQLFVINTSAGSLQYFKSYDHSVSDEYPLSASETGFVPLINSKFTWISH